MKLAYDVGCYDGSDAAHYLKLGYRVVCIEADPVLAEKIQQRFAAAIRDGRCKVLPFGVGDQHGVLPFYLSRKGIWNSFDRSMAERAGPVKTIEVPIRPLGDVISEHGAPDFVKIDVEGVDFACLRSLTEPFPQFMSFEVSKEDGAEMILLLIRRGYNRFALIDQGNFRSVRVPPAGSPQSLMWTSRQILRLELRKRPWIHNMLRRFDVARGRNQRTPEAGQGRETGSAGPTPMERRDGWYSATQFMWLWQNMLDSGLVDSSWYDVHAAK